MLNTINSTISNCNNRLTFNGTPQEVAKKALKIKLTSPQSIQDFSNEVSKETPEILRKAAALLKENAVLKGLVENIANCLEKKPKL